MFCQHTELVDTQTLWDHKTVPFVLFSGTTFLTKLHQAGCPMVNREESMVDINDHLHCWFTTRFSTVINEVSWS